MTIKDLSAQTGYSVGTISRVLNNQPNVSEKARKAILAAAEASGFQLNTNAKQLKQQHGTSILVVVKGVSNEMFSSCVEVLQTHTAATRYPLVVDYIDENDRLLQFDRAEDIIPYFCKFRLSWYEKRKKHIIDMLMKEILVLGNRAKFIKAIIDKKLKVSN